MKSMILNVMKKYEITSVLVTLIMQWRDGLITKEIMKEYYNAKIKYFKIQSYPNVNLLKTSVNDDLESLLGDLQIGRDFKESTVWSYFLPKLTDKELKLVKMRDENHLKTYSCYGLPGRDPDIDENEMNLSKSKSKFLKADCFRYTFKIENQI